MANKGLYTKLALKTVQRYHQKTLNTLGDQETLVDAVSRRPGFFGPNPVMYLSLFARRPCLQRGDVDDVILNDRTLIRACAFRGSLFLLSTVDYTIYFRACFHLLRQSAMSQLESIGIGENVLRRVAKAMEKDNFTLAKSTEEMLDLLRSILLRRLPIDLERLILRKLCDYGILVRTSTKGWKGNFFNYALVHNWIPEVALRLDSPESARTEVVRRYLRCYGPASLEDIVWWTGLPLSQIQRSLSHLRRELYFFQLESHREEMMFLKEEVDSLYEENQGEKRILFLPPWDPFMQGWHTRRRVAEKEILPYVYDAAGNSASVIVEEGNVIGLWQFRDTQPNVLELYVFPQFKHRHKDVMYQAEEQATVLLRLTGSVSVSIQERVATLPLSKRENGAFLWPLGIGMEGDNFAKVKVDSPFERRVANTFRSRYLDSDYVVRPPIVATEPF